MTPSWKNKSEIVRDGEKKSVSVMAEKKTAPRCPLQPALEKRRLTPSIEKRSDEFCSVRCKRK